MPDPIEQLFAGLRAETLPTVRPPGTEPLRRAVRRRRAVTSAAAAVTVLTLAALIAVIRPDSGRPVATPPTYSGAVLTERITSLLKLDDPQRAGLSQILLDTGSGMPESRRPVLGGTYEIRMVCFGSGTLEVMLGTAVRPILCPADGASWTAATVVPEPGGPLTVRPIPRDGGPGPAGFGYVADLTQADKTRWQEAATEALGPTRDEAVASGSFFASDGGEGYDHRTVGAGRYRVRAICLGFGTARIFAGLGNGEQSPEKQTTVQCSPDTPRTASLIISASTEGVGYYVEPSSDADHRAAVATVLERL
ncbi:hypothetical protein Aph02nite_49770 [Actinoplanes philippinensis]|uniref:Uncharacterized protein n=1 Tax=Actinoplanes philippinensis TaxID=35752 RepID=A0A1I2IT45_9ACTN|nr:hypothetical protein [Actinoplanes philippinensis]GIE79027.1 hypothetical protein Aph02nite_49770 [Actinoplanes philippinensis]SFF44793.1 hypothetical protein SAMN05421541_110384 [Actinoplanes philippinensis]